jgi:uncharacterized protein YhdP
MRRGLRFTLSAFAVLLLSLVLGLLALRLVLPHWEGLAAQVEQRTGTLIGRDVRLASLQIGWSGWVPELVARDVRIEGAGMAPLVASELGVSLDPLRSLRARSPVFRQARLTGVDLQVMRDVDGTWDVHGWRFGGGGTVAVDWKRHFAGMERLQITDGTLRWEDSLSGIRTALFVDSIGLRADAAGLRLAGRGSLFPEAGGPVYVGIMVPPAGPDRIEFYIEAQDLQLSYWTPLAGWLEHGPQGTGSVRLWADLEDGRVRRLQGEHRSRLLVTERDSPHIQELGHRFRWHRRGSHSESHWSATTPGAGDLRLEYHGGAPGQPLNRITIAAAGVDLGKFAHPVARLRLRETPGIDWLGELDLRGQLDQLYLDLERDERGWGVDIADAFVRDLCGHGSRGDGGLRRTGRLPAMEWGSG